MRCPFCDFENIQGMDQCARCHVDLTHPGAIETHADIERDLLKRPLGELLAQDYVTVLPSDSVGDVIRRLHETSHHCAIVIEEERVVGILTERDVLTKIAHRYDDCAGRAVREFMTPNPATLNVENAVAFGLNRMMVGGYRHVPVKRDGKLAGVVSVRHILGYLVDHFPDVLGAGTPKPE